MWYIESVAAFRKHLPWLSLLLLAVLVPVQAAACCKWSALLGGPMDAEPAASASRDLSGGMPADHACCRKAPSGTGLPASAPSPAPDDCATGDAGCCLEKAPSSEAALASAPAASTLAPGYALLPLLPAGESPRVAPRLPSRTAPEPSGPPPYLAHLRLLI